MKVISHQPFNAPRQGHSGERIYAERWAAIADERDATVFDDDDATVFSNMFRHYRWEAGQREATVAASLICWIATNCGRGFAWEAQRLREVLGISVGGDTAWLMAWARENARQYGVNRGVRVLEHVLSPYDRGDMNSRFPEWDRIEEPSGRDMEAAECVVRWMGSAEGQAFLVGCQRAADQERRREDLRRMKLAGHGDSPAARMCRDELAALAAA